MMMEAISFSEASINTYQNAECDIPENSHLKSYQVFKGPSVSKLLLKARRP
jgi:hypothetical protein